MRIEIRHSTRYHYSRDVSLAPMTLRLRPRDDASQRLLQFATTVSPEPAGVSDLLDLEGNTLARMWFDATARSLSINLHATVETQRSNPFDFVLEDGAVRIPFGKSKPAHPMFDVFARPTSFEEADGRNNNGASDLAQRILGRANGETVPFLTQLTSTLADEHEMIVRPTGDPWPPEQTLREKRGSCRDLTVLFNEACRSVGLAARFVSGYQIPGGEDVGRELHAWSEVYLPGAGWRGFDASAGLAVADRHIAVVAARDPSDAAPVTGSYRGTDAEATLETRVTVRIADASNAASVNAET